MNRVIGRAAARQHADDCVDKSPRRQRRRRRRRGLLGIRAVADPNIAAQTAHRGASQRRAQRRPGIDKRRARQLQAHQFEHHLIRVRGAVKSASPGRVIRRGLRRQQRLAPDLAGRMALPHARFFGVVKAGRHRPRGRENDRQMAESRRRDSHPGRDFVAHAQKNNSRNASCESATAAAIATTSREKSDNSIPARPCVTPSHIAGTPPATCAVAPQRRAVSRIRDGNDSNGRCAESISL